MPSFGMKYWRRGHQWRERQCELALERAIALIMAPEVTHKLKQQSLIMRSDNNSGSNLAPNLPCCC